MNAWVFRHLDELQRIYTEPAPDLPTVPPADAPPARRPAPPGAAGEAPRAVPRVAPPGTSGEADPFADGEGPEGAAGGPRPGSVLRHETPEGPDVVLIPRATGGRGGRRRRPGH